MTTATTMQRYTFLLIITLGVTAAFLPSHQHAALVGNKASSTRPREATTTSVLFMADDDDDDDDEPTNVVDDEEPAAEKPVATQSDRYDVSKLVGGASEDGGGFNQFDPVLSATGFLSRRFGIFGGLAIFAALAAVEGKEILRAFGDNNAVEGTGETITTPTGLKITELLVGGSGSAPLPGYVIGLRAKVSIGDKVIYETTAGEKPIAFKYGQRPFQNVICEGVEEGIKGMKVGGKRVLDVPSGLAPPGVELPPGVPLIYEVELTEVLSGYF